MTKERFTIALRAVAVALAMLLPFDASLAQVVTQLPQNVNNAVVLDMGNGPLELRIVQGNMLLATAQGAGTSTTVTASTTMTLTATPAIPPCVGCNISGAGITSGTTVTAFNGTTGITLSAAMTVANNTPVAWGAACPTTLAGFPVTPVQAGVGGDIPLYTQARICAGALSTPGAAILPFPIGAH